MKCKFCQKDKKLIKAHIIPEGFFRRLRDGQDPPRILTEKDFPKRAPIGVYDTAILCADCEKMFGDWDHQGQMILAEAPIGEPIKNNEKIVAYKISDFNYDHLKLFFISLLWRASVSSQPFYKRIKLGPYEKITKNHIENSNPGSDEDFAITISRFDDHQFSSVTLDPHTERFQGVNYCRFYMASYVVYVKVDKRLAPSPLNQFRVKKEEPIYVICRDLARSKELPLIYKVGKSANHRVNTDC
jgi:hypothetical protein